MIIVGSIGMLVIAISSGSEGRNFDDLAAEANVRQPEPPTDQPTVAEQGSYLIRVGVCRNIEIFGMQIKQRIAHAAADQKRLKSRFVQPVQDFERAFGNFCPRNIVGRAGNDFRLSGFFGPAAIQ